MKVAVPLFGKDVAPRFGYADNFLIAEIKDKRVVQVENIKFEFASWSGRLGRLRNTGVDVILCGGFNRCFAPFAQNLGIIVLAGLVGDARQLIEAFAGGDTMTTFQCRGAGMRRHAGNGCNRNKGH